jgi:hypothetical protein
MICWALVLMEVAVAQKGAGGNPGAITAKGGDGARGSTGTGRGGGSRTGARATSKKKAPDKVDHDGPTDRS